MRENKHVCSVSKARVSSLLLITTLLLPAFYLKSVTGADEVTLSTDRTEYHVSETVIFSGAGYSPSGSSYEIRIYFEGSLVEKIEFESVTVNSVDSIPDGVTWTIPIDAKSGKYTAEAYNVTEGESFLTSCEFDVFDLKESLTKIIENLDGLENFVNESVESKDCLLSSLSNSISKLNFAIALYEENMNHTAANQLRAARNMLTAFIHKVLAQSGKSIDNETASHLIEEADNAIRVIDSLIGSTLTPLGKQLALNVQNTLVKQERHLNRFMLRIRICQAETDDEIISFINSTEREMIRTLERLRERNRELERFLENGSIDYQELLMELQKGNETAGSVKEIAELLLDELTALNVTKPGLGKHLGQFIQIAKALETNSTDTTKSMEESILRGKSHGRGDGGQKENKGTGEEKGKDHDNDKGKYEDKNGGGKEKDNNKGKGNNKDNGKGHSKRD